MPISWSVENLFPYITANVTSIRFSEVDSWKEVGWRHMFLALQRLAELGRLEGKGRWRVRSLAFVGCRLGTDQDGG